MNYMVEHSSDDSRWTKPKVQDLGSHSSQSANMEGFASHVEASNSAIDEEDSLALAQAERTLAFEQQLQKQKIIDSQKTPPQQTFSPYQTIGDGKQFENCEFQTHQMPSVQMSLVPPQIEDAKNQTVPRNIEIDDEEVKLQRVYSSAISSQSRQCSHLSKNIRIRCSPILSQPTAKAYEIGLKQMILSKLPSVDLNILHGTTLTELNNLLKISRTVEMMAPKGRGQPMLQWVLEQLRFFNMFNSRLVHQKLMVKSSFLRSKTEQFVFCDPISRCMQPQLELFLEAINEYYADRLEKNNVILELNCAFEKTDIFEPFACDYRLCNDDSSGQVQRLKKPWTLKHREGDIFSIVFVDARRPQYLDTIEPEVHVEHVQQYVVGVLLEDDGIENHAEGSHPGLVGLKQRRQPSNEIYFKKLGRGDEFQSLYQLGGSADLPLHQSLPRQVIVGRMGLIYYIGPMLDNKGFKHQAHEHIRDTSIGIVNDRLFKVESRFIIPAEVNKIYQFCKNFESQFGREISNMLEYRIQMVDRTTYFVEDAQQKSYEVQITVLAEERKQEKLKRLKATLEDLKNLKTIDITIDWKHVKDAIFLSEEQFETVCPQTRSGRSSVCAKCGNVITPDEIVGMVRQDKNDPRLYCQSCVFANRDNYQEFHNHYWRTQLTDHLYTMELVSSLRCLHEQKAIIRFPDVSNELNELYVEGLNATKAGHYAEREFVDHSFAQPCNECGVEITFLMFTCLGCRNMSLCEQCYFKQLEEEETPEVSSVNESDRSHCVTPTAMDGQLIYSPKQISQGKKPVERRVTMKEHTKNHVFVRSYDYQEPKIQFS